jgi:hypothetical protein
MEQEICNEDYHIAISTLNNLLKTQQQLLDQESKLSKVGNSQTCVFWC